MSIVLGIDIGTQSVKVVLYNALTGMCDATASSALRIKEEHGGVAEQEADWWTNGLREALNQIDPNLRKGVMAIGVSGQQHGFVPVDRMGEPIAPVKLWCDTSTSSECDYLTREFGGAASCIAELGNPILPGYTASKLLWFRKAHPELYAKMKCILLPHDYLNLFLTGEKTMESGDASGTGFMDVRKRTWSEKMLNIIDSSTDLRDLLPEITTVVKPIGRLLPNIAKELGLPASIPVAPGGGDNMMAAIGTGNVKPGVVTMSLGTSGTVYSYSETPVIDPKGNIAGFCSSNGGWLPLICTMNCTVGTELIQQLFNANIAEFELSLKNSSRGACGVLAVPYFNGERTPNLAGGKACLFGLDGQNMQRENFFRAVVEGVSFGLYYGLERMAEQGICAKEIVLTGGGSNSQIWRQIVADICNVNVSVPKQQETAAFGAALQALAIISEEELEEIAQEHVKTDQNAGNKPDPESVDFYREHYQSYLDAAAHVATIYERKAAE